MEHKAISIRPFIGSKNFELSRSFYRDLGFDERVLTPTLSVMKIGQLAFYLQSGYVQEWVENTMIFLEVDDVDRYWKELSALELPGKYTGVRLTPIKEDDWGSECFLHDPSGILWHFGAFKK